MSLTQQGSQCVWGAVTKGDSGRGLAQRASKGRVRQGRGGPGEDLAFVLRETGNPWRAVSTGVT